MSDKLLNMLRTSLKNYANQFWQFTTLYLQTDSPMTSAQKTKVKNMRGKALNVSASADATQDQAVLEKWNDVLRDACTAMTQDVLDVVPEETYNSFEIEQAE